METHRQETSAPGSRSTKARGPETKRMRKNVRVPRAEVTSIVSAIVLVTLLSTVLGSGTQHTVIMILIWGSLAVSWNIVGGFAGQISLGHAGFFGTGAYTTAILYLDLGISPWFGIIIGALIAGLLGLLIAYPSFRLTGPYYALATLAFGIIMLRLVVDQAWLTRGGVGISIPYEPGFQNFIWEHAWIYTLVCGIMLGSFILVSRLVINSRLGYRLIAVRGDERAARAVGVPAMIAKTQAAVISAVMAGICGGIYAQYILFLDTTSVFGITVSIEALAVAIVGGSGRVYGPLVGAALLVPIGDLTLEYFGGSGPGFHSLIYASLLVIVVLFARGGVFGELEKLVRAIRSRSGSGTAKPSSKEAV